MGESVGAKGEGACRPRGGQEGFALLPSLGALCFHLLFSSQNNPTPTRNRLLWPETDDEDEEEEGEDAKVEILGSSGEESGWMDQCGWDGGERVDAIGEERPLSRSTRTPCQSVHLSMLPSSAEIACRTLWTRDDGKEHWPCSGG